MTNDASRNTPQRLLRSISRMEAILGMMACLSIVLIFAPRDWMTKTKVFSPRDYPAVLSDDRYSGGNSATEWVDKQKQIWKCELGEKIQAPYCGLQISVLNDTWSGFDLRNYDEMTVWVNYKGDGDSVRLYLRNRHPNYYVVGDPTSTKYNMVEVPLADLETGLTFKLSDFSVADWWLASRKVELKDSHAEFNDVIYIELQSGSTMTHGTHEFQLNQITWRGSLISDETLYKAIIISWSVFIFLLLMFRVISLKWELSKNQRYQEELISINKLLNLQNKQFEDLAKTDQLTGLLNRIGIRDALYDGLRDWKASRKPFSLVMIDIDHFKQVNDTHGHDVGDQILSSSAQLFRENVRRSDYLARWGGEEFVLVCPDTDLHQAHVVAELLRKKLDASPVYRDLKVTASFGVATLSQPNLDHLFKCADEALYEAKHKGRNQVVIKHD